MSASSARKKRKQLSSSINRLLSKLNNLERVAAETVTFDLTTETLEKLIELDRNFKAQHYQVLEYIDEADEEELAKEQEEPDGHDDTVAVLIVTGKE